MIYKFGDYILDAQQYELRRAGTLVSIRLKALELLMYLVRHRERLVSKEELLDHIWDGRAIGPSTLDSCLMEVRRAINDNGRAQRMIRTLRGRGYRFMAVVEAQRPTSLLTVEPAAMVSINGFEETPATNNPETTPSAFPNASLKTPSPILSQLTTGEYKTVTVLVCSLQDALSSHHNEPEQSHRLRQAVLLAVVEEVQRYGGTVQRLDDDELLVLFGAPHTLEDHALRSIQAAQEIHRRLRQDFDANGQPPMPVTARSSLHTGPVIIGSLADDIPLTVTSVNDTLPLVHRLLVDAQPGQILLSDATLKKVRNFIHTEAVGSVDNNGQTQTTHVYRLLGSRHVDKPLALPHSRFRSHFVGRKQELSILETRLTQVEQGQGQVVSIVGDPGMGKTRLLAEFRRHIGHERATVAAGHCMSYGQTIPYLPLRTLLRQICGLDGQEGLKDATARVQATLRSLEVKADEAPFLLHLLDVPVDSEQLTLLTPEALRTQIFSLLRELCVQVSQQRPLLLVVENLHWIDPSSEAFLVSLVEILARYPILLLTTFRPGYQPPWMEKSYATQMTLPCLKPGESRAIVHTILSQLLPEETLLQQILFQAEGNPFFLEELAKSVQEQNPLHTAPVVPDTIQEVLMSRIDRLPPETKRVLQTASVIGRKVAYHILAAMWETAEGLESHLHDLQRLELLYAQSNVDGPSYSFKHMLTKDAVYDSMLDTQRQALHQAVGEVLENVYADRLEEIYDLLAYHYAKTDDANRAIQYLIMVAERAARSHAHAEALAALQEALRHSEQLPASQRDSGIVNVVIRLSNSLLPLGRLQESCDLLCQQQARVSRLGESKMIGLYYLRLGHVYHNLGQRKHAAQNAKRALTIASRHDDVTTMGKANYVLAREGIWEGKYRESVRFGQQAVSLLEHSTDSWWLGMAYMAQGSAYAYMGEFESALQASTQARTIGVTIADRSLKSYSANLTGRCHARRGDWQAAIAAHRDALACSPEPLLAGVIMDALGDAYLGHGDVEQAIPILEKAVQHLERFGPRPVQVSAMVHLSEAYLLRGYLDQARELATRGLALTRETSFRNGMGLILRALGRIAQGEGDLQAAKQHFSEALELFTQSQAFHQVGHIHIFLAKLAHAQGKQHVVTNHLKQAEVLFKQLCLSHYVQQTTQLAGELGVKLDT